MSSVLDEVRALRDAIATDSVKELDVPGLGGRIVIRYAPPPREELTPQLAVILAGGTVAGEDLDVDVVIRCTQEILKREGGKLVPLADGDPVRFDKSDDRLAEAIGFPAGLLPRAQAHELFMSKQQPWAIDRHYLPLVDWLQGIDNDRRARVEGESGAASAES